MLKRNKALEDLMRYLTQLDPEQVNEELQDENNKFAEIVCLLIDKFCNRDDHSSIKALELQVLSI